MTRPAKRAPAPAAEVEAKFLARNLTDLSRIAAVQRLGPHRLRPRSRDALHSTYFDTAELSLLGQRVSLRVRRKRGRFEATAKWMGKVRGAIHERPELNVPLESAPRRGFALPEGPLHELLCATVAGRKLVPILVTDIERRAIDVLHRDAAASAAPLAELALDHVRLVDPARRAGLLAEYAEIEIELRDGTRAELADVARRLQRAFGLVASDDSKFARGLSLRLGRALPNERPRAVPEARDSVDSAARKVFGGLLSRIREHDPGTRRGDDAEALHQLRVSVRRARAALRVFEAAWAPAERRTLARELRWLGRALGAVRDLDVQLEALTADRAQTGGAGLRALAELQVELERRRGAERERLFAVLNARRYFRLLIRLERFARGERVGRTPKAAQAALGAAGREHLERVIGKLDKRGRKLVVRKQPDAEHLHALRIRAKRARYALEFLSELTGKPGKRLVKRLVELQDLLGAHQDATVAVELIAQHRARLPSGALGVERALDELAAQHEAKAARARAEFPAAFRRWTKAESAELPGLLRQLTSGARAARPRSSGARAARPRKGST